MLPLERLKDDACRRIDADRDALVALSRRIHAQPELKFEEHRAAAWLCEYLAERGFAVEPKAYGLQTAFAARMGTGEPKVAILCEYDALPGIGHACGHNIIAAAGAGAGVGLRDLVGETGGSVVVLGTPAEEGGGGKIIMARHGAFENVAAAMMVHPAGADLVAMTVLAVSELTVEYRGRAAHASAFPHKGVNALDALVTAYSAIAQLRQHIRQSERIHGIITDGGQAANIVPERAAGLFMVRAATEQGLRKLRQRVNACFEAGALATGATLEIKPAADDYSDMLTNQVMANAYAANLGRLGRNVQSLDGMTAVAGSTDMGNVSKIVPSIHPMIAVAPPGVPLHSSDFTGWAGSDQGDKAVIDGAKAMAMTALDILCQADLRTTMSETFSVDLRQNAGTR
jgi:amidohydrolase